MAKAIYQQPVEQAVHQEQQVQLELMVKVTYQQLAEHQALQVQQEPQETQVNQL